jgi:hypothetical protein
VSIWTWFTVVGGVIFLAYYGYTVWFYLRGRGREDLENAIKSLLVLGGNGGYVEILCRGRGVILVIERGDGELNGANLRIRIPFRTWSLPFGSELQRVFSRSGYDFSAVEGSIEWIAEVRMPVINIWAVGSAAKAAEAVNLALDVFGYEHDARFNLAIKGKKNWRRMSEHK